MIIPWYVRNIIILIGLSLFVYIIVVGRQILMPVALGLLMALLLFPWYKKLLKLKIPRVWAAFLCMLVVFIILLLIGWFIGLQVAAISKDMPQISQKINVLIDKGGSFIEDRFNISPETQAAYLKKGLQNLSSSGTGMFSSTLAATADLITFSFLFILSFFFFLYYKEHFRDFVFKVFSNTPVAKLSKVLYRLQEVTHNYIAGLFTVMIIVGVLNTTGLLALGIGHAVFFGMLGSFLMIIPFVGILFASFLTILYALVTTDSLFYPAGVAVVFWFVQVLEANVITPNIVGDKISLNPFAVVIAIFVGGAVWGGAGMIMFIPFTAMLKVLCDAYAPLEPYAFLLGEPPKPKKNNVLSKITEKLKPKRE